MPRNPPAFGLFASDFSYFCKARHGFLARVRIWSAVDQWHAPLRKSERSLTCDRGKVDVTDSSSMGRKTPLKTETGRWRISTANHRLRSISQPGCYTLVIELSKARIIRVGKLGETEFQPGTYLYTGSAMAGLRARLLRHLSNKKKLRWHIDYFLNDKEARIKKIVLYPAAPGQECWQNQKIGALRGALSVGRKFGASDCKAGCPSHMISFSPGYRPRIKGIEIRLS